MSNKCKICLKSVYPMDPQINLDGSIFHKACAKCADCSCQITLSNFTKCESEGAVTLLCKTHYFKRFHEQGSYLGGDKFQVKNPRDEKSSGVPAPVSSSTSNQSQEAAAPAYAGIKLKSAKESDAAASAAAANIEAVQIQDLPVAPAPTPEPSVESSFSSAVVDAAIAQLTPPNPPEEASAPAEELVAEEPAAEEPAAEANESVPAPDAESNEVVEEQAEVSE